MKKDLISFLESEEMQELRKSIQEKKTEDILYGNVLLGQMPELEPYILSTIIEAEKGEGCSYRYLIYTSLEAGQASYAPLQLAGMLDFHNKFYDEPTFMSDYKLNFTGKDKYLSLSFEDRIAIISAVLNKIDNV